MACDLAQLLQPDELVEYVSINPDTDEVLARRTSYNTYAKVPRSDLRAKPYN